MIFSASEIGGCARAIVANRLEYEPVARPAGDEDRLRYYTSLEAVAADQIAAMGFKVFQAEPSICSKCQRERGIVRHGFHIELTQSDHQIVGHIDRKVALLDGTVLPVEIKTLGRFEWPKFQKSGFKEFPTYAGQESCYLQHECSSGLYWVLNRDTGQVLRYVIPFGVPDITLTGFETLFLPVTFSEIELKARKMVEHIEKKTLPEVDTTRECQWCGYRYLCDVPKYDEELVRESELQELANTYAELFEQKKVAETELESIKEKFLTYARNAKLSRFRCSRVSVSYSGLKTKRVVDENVLRQLVDEDILNAVYKESKSWEDIRIKVLD